MNLCIYRFETGENRKASYEKMTVKIDQICEVLVVAAFATTLWIALFPLVYTIFAYYILDLGGESFYLYPLAKFV